MAFPSSTDVPKLLQEIESTERKLKQTLKAPQPDEREVKALRNGLMRTYEQLLVLDYECASRNQVEQNLWKIVFYKRIEEFRKRHGKTSTLLNDPEKKHRAQQALAQITTGFARFLDKATDFYMSLLFKLLAACNVRLDGYSTQTAQHPGLAFLPCDESIPKHRERKKGMLMSCERCLIFLGDLERYRSLYMQTEAERNWSAAERHYHTASLLTPHVGNPHNQLAVLATYRGDDLAGMFHYGRAVLSAQPFATARENILLLLDKNRQKLDTFLRAKPAGPQRIGLDEQARRRQEEVGLRWVRVQGILQTQRELERFGEEEGAALVEVVAALDADALSEEFVLQLAAVAVFSAHDLAARPPARGEGAQRTAAVAEAEQRAVVLALKLLGRLAVSARGRPGQLQGVGVLCGWLCARPQLLTSPPDADGGGDARRELLNAAAALVDLVNLRKEPAAAAGAWGEVLPEDKLLAAFEPLAGVLTGLEGAARDGLLGQLAVVEGAEEAARARMGRVGALLQRLAGARPPVVYWDSQSGAYSVESLPASQASLHPRSQPRAQDRADARPPPPAPAPEAVPAHAALAPGGAGASGRGAAAAAAHPSLLQERAPLRQGGAASMAPVGVQRAEAPGGGQEGGGGALTVQDMVMEAAAAAGQQTAGAGAAMAGEAAAEGGETGVLGPLAMDEEDDAERNEATFGEDCMDVGGSGQPQDEGFGALAMQTAAFAAEAPPAQAQRDGSGGAVTGGAGAGGAGGAVGGEGTEMGFSMEELVNSAIGSPGKAPRRDGYEEEVFMIRPPPPEALPPPALSFGNVGGAQRGFGNVTLGGGAGEGGGHTAVATPAGGGAHRAPGGEAGLGFFGSGGLGGFGAGRTGFGAGPASASVLHGRSEGDADRQGGPGGGQGGRGTLLPPSAFGYTVPGFLGTAQVGSGLASGSFAGGLGTSAEASGLERVAGASSVPPPPHARFVTRNPFA